MGTADGTLASYKMFALLLFKLSQLLSSNSYSYSPISDLSGSEEIKKYLKYKGKELY